MTGHYLGGDAIGFYRRLKGLSFKEAVRELAEQYGITLACRSDRAKQKRSRDRADRRASIGFFLCHEERG
jgi:DNA primase